MRGTLKGRITRGFRRRASAKSCVLSCADPRFCQCIPHEDVTLIEGNSRSSDLRYRDNRNDAEYVVPNIWYNQPIEWQIEYHRFHSGRFRERIAILSATMTSRQRWALESLESALSASERALTDLLARQARGEGIRTPTIASRCEK